MIEGFDHPGVPLAADHPDGKMMEKLQKNAAEEVSYRAGYCHSMEPDHVMNFKT